jgi:hypothetical protein
MSSAVLDKAFRHIVEESEKAVAALGFRRQGVTLKILRLENVGLIEFQKSAKSSDEQILFTINLAIICGRLLEEGQSLERAKSMDAQLRQRIGGFLHGHPDKWWLVKAGTNIDALADEVANLLATEGAPYIVRYLDTTQLLALWESGKSPGITEIQRTRYLAKLKKSENGSPA